METLRKIFLIVVLGGLSGLLAFQLALEHKIPIQVGSLTSKPGNQTQTVVKEENAIIDVVEKVSPSVVAIGVSQKVYNPFDPLAAPRSKQDQTIGTGFIVSDKGVIVTNKHVVSDSSVKYSVVTKDGKKLDIKKIYRDPANDLAIVSVDSTAGLKPLDLGDSSHLKVGQTAIAIGNALGKFSNTVTTGIVSGIGRAVDVGDPFSYQTESLSDLIQTDAAINPGNSGGPLLNSAGQVIGINVATTTDAQNIGFAIPINAVKALVDDFEKNGTITRAFMGIQYRLVDRTTALEHEIPEGAFILQVVPDSPADKAGISQGDIITKIDGQLVRDETKISQTIQAKKPGEGVSLEVWTDGKSRTINVTLAQSPNQ